MSNILNHIQTNETPEHKRNRKPLWLDKRSKLEKTLLTSLLMVAVVAFIGFVYNSTADDFKECDSNICNTPECLEAASLLRKSMDENVNPCDDFYRFVCGEWIRKHPAEKVESTKGVYQDQGNNLWFQLKELMETKLNGTEKSFIVMIKAMYDTCIDLESIGSAGSKPLQNIFKLLGGWPVVEGSEWDESKFDWIQTLISLREFAFSDAFFYVSVNDENKSMPIIQLEPMNFDTQHIFNYSQDFNESYPPNKYIFMERAATLLGADEVTYKNEIWEILKFLATLEEIWLQFKEERKNTSENYDIYTIRELQEKIPQVSWLNYISGPLTHEITENETLRVVSPELVAKFVDLITMTKKRVVANFIFRRVLFDTYYILSKEWRAIRHFDKEFVESNRWYFCLWSTQNNLNPALSSYYIQHFIKDEIKDEAVKLAKYVHKEFLRILDETDWMDEKSKANAKAKSNNMTFYMGYREELLNITALMELYENLNISKDGYFENMLRLHKWQRDNYFSKLRKPTDNKDKEWENFKWTLGVNGHYNDDYNSIMIPAGNLRSFFFNKNHPNYMNFAMTGGVTGHEIGHAFDERARRIDKEKNRWRWEKFAEENFRKKTKCLVDQYNNYTVESGTQVNGTKTLDDNIADNSAYQIAYWAYQSWVKDNGPEKVLPGLNYNQNQLFWISVAYKRCVVYEPRYLEERMKNGVHSPAEFRINGPLSNLVEFAKDFNCPIGSPMNKRNKCRLW